MKQVLEIWKKNASSPSDIVIFSQEQRKSADIYEKAAKIFGNKLYIAASYPIDSPHAQELLSILNDEDTVNDDSPDDKFGIVKMSGLSTRIDVWMTNMINFLCEHNGTYKFRDRDQTFFSPFGYIRTKKEKWIMPYKDFGCRLSDVLSVALLTDAKVTLFSSETASKKSGRIMRSTFGKLKKDDKEAFLEQAGIKTQVVKAGTVLVLSSYTFMKIAPVKKGQNVILKSLLYAKKHKMFKKDGSHPEDMTRIEGFVMGMFKDAFHKDETANVTGESKEKWLQEPSYPVTDIVEDMAQEKKNGLPGAGPRVRDFFSAQGYHLQWPKIKEPKKGKNGTSREDAMLVYAYLLTLMRAPLFKAMSLPKVMSFFREYMIETIQAEIAVLQKKFIKAKSITNIVKNARDVTKKKIANLVEVVDQATKFVERITQDGGDEVLDALKKAVKEKKKRAIKIALEGRVPKTRKRKKPDDNPKDKEEDLGDESKSADYSIEMVKAPLCEVTLREIAVTVQKMASLGASSDILQFDRTCRVRVKDKELPPEEITMMNQFILEFKRYLDTLKKINAAYKEARDDPEKLDAKYDLMALQNTHDYLQEWADNQKKPEKPPVLFKMVEVKKKKPRVDPYSKAPDECERVDCGEILIADVPKELALWKSTGLQVDTDPRCIGCASTLVYSQLEMLEKWVEKVTDDPEEADRIILSVNPALEEKKDDLEDYYLNMFDLPGQKFLSKFTKALRKFVDEPFGKDTHYGPLDRERIKTLIHTRKKLTEAMNKADVTWEYLLEMRDYNEQMELEKSNNRRKFEGEPMMLASEDCEQYSDEEEEEEDDEEQVSSDGSISIPSVKVTNTEDMKTSTAAGLLFKAMCVIGAESPYYSGLASYATAIARQGLDSVPPDVQIETDGPWKVRSADTEWQAFPTKKQAEQFVKTYFAHQAEKGLIEIKYED